MKAIIVAFTLKGQDFEKIKQVLISLRNSFGVESKPIVCIHGFMPRVQVNLKGWSTQVSDTLDWCFPVQLNMYDEKPLREGMARIGKKLDATVFVIGEVKEGVLDEVNLYKEVGLKIEYLPLN